MFELWQKMKKSKSPSLIDNLSLINKDVLVTISQYQYVIDIVQCQSEFATVIWKARGNHDIYTSVPHIHSSHTQALK